MNKSWHFLIYRAGPPAVRVRVAEDIWSLLRFDPEPEADSSPEALTAVLKERWGVMGNFLRCIHLRYDPTSDHADEIHSFELSEGAAADDPAYCWASEEDLSRIPPDDPIRGEAVREWLRENATNDVPPARSPWARPGWRAEALAWVTARLRERGIDGPVSVQLVKSWSISCVWRVTAGEFTAYFKASHSMFAAEAALTAFLSDRFPSSVPSLLAADRQRNWLLLGPFVDRPLRGEKEIAPWIATARLIGQIQRDCEDCTGELLALGCLHRPLASLSEGLDRLLSEKALLLMGEANGITKEEAARLSGLAPLLKEAIQRLDGFGLPLTLIHGDLHPGNVTVHNGSPVIYDWSDGAVTHPFMDFLEFLFLHDAYDGEDAAGATDHVRDAYLDAWRPLLPEAELLEAFELSQKIAPLYHALSYVWIRDHAEPSARWELEAGIPEFVRNLIGKWQPGEAASDKNP